MTAKKQSRKVTVNRRSKPASIPESGRKSVTVWLRDGHKQKSSQPVTVHTASNEQETPLSPAPAEKAAAPVPAAVENNVSAPAVQPAVQAAAEAKAKPAPAAPAVVIERPAPAEKPSPAADCKPSKPAPPPTPNKTADKPQNTTKKAVPTAAAVTASEKAAAPVTAVEAPAAGPAEEKSSPLPENDRPVGKWYIPQQWRDISLLRKLIMIVSAALALFSMLPLAVGVISPGIVPPVMIAAFFFLCALYWPLIDRCESTWGNVIIAVVAVCVLAGVTYLSFVSGKMISASANVLPEDRGDVTVVVLGCKVNGDKPSRMLHARLEKASEFLLEHPQAHCIVTGGKGPDEDYPEAYVMKNYLVDKGISPMRIIMEDKSTSTLENINFAAGLADIYNCHERFLIVTDRFHQYRAVTAANDLGIVSYALNVETAWYLAMPYWFREMAAITRDWLVD